MVYLHVGWCRKLHRNSGQLQFKCEWGDHRKWVWFKKKSNGKINGTKKLKYSQVLMTGILIFKDGGYSGYYLWKLIDLRFPQIRRQQLHPCY